MQDIILREFEESDEQEVEKFLRKIFAELRWIPGPKDYIDDVKGGFYDKGGFFILGKLQNSIVATAGFIELTPSTILLKRFYIDQIYRGKGVAQNLLQFILNILKNKGYQTLFLDVDMDNSRAIRFYEKEGFKKCTVESNPLWWESEEPDLHYFYKKDL